MIRAVLLLEATAVREDANNDKIITIDDVSEFDEEDESNNIIGAT